MTAMGRVMGEGEGYEGGDICVHTADSLCGRAESNAMS